jgi:hypothetical protein
MKNRPKILRLADRANTRFVGLVQMLVRLTSWRPASARSKKSVKAQTCKSRPRFDLPLDPEIYAELATKVERILKRSTVPGRSDSPKPKGDLETAIADPELKQKLKDLFHEDARRRATAVRWIRRRGFDQALPALEGVLSVEASDEVRAEIVRTMNELGARPEI